MLVITPQCKYHYTSNNGAIMLIICIGHTSKSDINLLTASFVSAKCQQTLMLTPAMIPRCCHCGASNDSHIMLIIYTDHTLELDRQLLIDPFISASTSNYTLISMPVIAPYCQCHGASNEGTIMLNICTGHMSNQISASWLTILLFQPMLAITL